MLKHLATTLWNRRRRSALLTLQILLSFVVLFAVLSYSFTRLASYREPLGFVTEDVHVVTLAFPPDLTADQRTALARRARTEVLALDDVRAAANLSWVYPFGGNSMMSSFGDPAQELYVEVFIADEHFAEVGEVTLAHGRWFRPEDTLGGRRPIVVNRMLEERFFPHGRLVDTVIAQGDSEYLVTGVVEHFKYGGEFSPEQPLMIWLASDNLANLAYRTAPGATPALETAVAERVAAVTKSREATTESLEQLRVRTGRPTWIPILTLAAMCAFLVANVALGLFGTLINAILRRRAEIGLRKALGATPAGIGLQFTGEVLLLAGVGLALGVAVAVQLPLVGFIEAEPRFFWYAGLSAAALILALVLACAFVPSRRAARTFAAEALRED